MGMASACNGSRSWRRYWSWPFEEYGSQGRCKNELAKGGVSGWGGREVRIRIRQKGERDDVGTTDVGCMLARKHIGHFHRVLSYKRYCPE